MEMDSLCEELDEAKAEIDKLRADLRCKTELSENLRKAHNEQLVQIKEASAKIERQGQELSQKFEEISEVKQNCDSLRRSLNEKESIIRHLSIANDRLRVDCNEKNQKWEEEKRRLVLALDEANEKNEDQDQTIRSLKAEVEGLEGLLSASKKRCVEVEKAPKGLRGSEEELFKLEEQNRKVEDQLKWKKEQFKHLEEAHEKLRVQSKESKKERELETSTLIDNICSLQSGLDSQTRISEDLQERLQMCNQALAHEESRRKYLEIEVSEFKSHFESVFTECQDTKSQLECLTTQRDKEIAALRSSLGNKEMLYKEVEYRAGRLEQENQELLASLKELQVAQIQEVGNSSLAKLRSKLTSVEQMHRDCSAKLRAKEAEWSSQLDNLSRELNSYKSDVECKEAALKDLELELETCYSVIMQLKLQNEEESLMLLVLKSGIAEAGLNLENYKAELIVRDTERDEKLSLLMKELEVKNNALAKALAKTEEERQKTATLVERVNSLAFTEQKQFLMEKELERHKERLEESSARQLCFKEPALQKEGELNDKIRALCDALDIKNSDLALERDRAKSLSRRVEFLDFVEERRLLMQKELENYKQMVNESSRHQVLLEEQALQIESVSRQKLKEVNDELTAAKSELAEYREKVTSLLRRVDSLVLLEEQQLLMQGELRRCKEMLEESSRKQRFLEERASNVETEFSVKLRNVCDALDDANFDLAEEHQKAASLSRKLESLNLLEKKQLMMQNEMARYREMLKESSRRQLHLEEQAVQKQNEYKKKLKEVCDALDKVNTELAATVCEGHAVEFELWIWKSIAERLKDDLEENQALRKQLEASLIAQIEVGETTRHEKDGLVDMLNLKDSSIANLQEQIQLHVEELKTQESARTEAVLSNESEKESILRIAREKAQVLGDLQKEIEWLEEESLRRELEVAVFAQTGAEQAFDHEKESLMKLVEEKEQRMNNLMQLVTSLEQQYKSSLICFSSQLAKKETEIMLVHEAWQKIVAAEILAQLEIEEKKLMIAELEDDINSIQQKLESQVQSSSYSKEQALKVEADAEAKQLELKELTNTMTTKLRMSEALVDELKAENRSLVKDVEKLSLERESLLHYLGLLSDRITQFSSEDMQLMGTLERIVQSLDSGGSSLVHKGDEEISEYAKENVNSHPSPTTRKFRATLEERSPFREVN